LRHRRSDRHTGEHHTFHVAPGGGGVFHPMTTQGSGGTTSDKERAFRAQFAINLAIAGLVPWTV
jgi:hypothetical protein